MCAGHQIESAYFPGEDNLYCSFSIMKGADWQVLLVLQRPGICTRQARANRPDAVDHAPVGWDAGEGASVLAVLCSKRDSGCARGGRLSQGWSRGSRRWRLFPPGAKPR